jgi:hypothetical protein
LVETEDDHFLKARYAVSVIAVGVALMAVSVCQHFSVHEPSALIYLAAIALKPLPVSGYLQGPSYH